MRRSTDRILTTHVGSLPRPADLREMWAKPTRGPAEEALQTRLRSAVGEVVLAQVKAGIDIPNDGEFGKPMRAAVRCGAHRLAELAIVRNINAGLHLSAHDLAHGRAQARLQRFFRGPPRWLRPHFAQVGGPGKTADMRGQNSVSASSHFSIPPLRYRLLFEPASCKKILPPRRQLVGSIAFLLGFF